MMNTLFNTSSGFIEVGDYVFTGHNVSIITGTHDYNLLLSERMLNFPSSGRDIFIGKGVWIGSNAVILGPCRVGDHAVIAAGSIVLPRMDISTGTVVAGIPARPVKTISAVQSDASESIRVVAK
jgi:acetyltransferase-like isoleucine patch superfamily enzyme